MTRALVLAAGLGTRLSPVTLELPKALVPVGDRPVLEHVLGRLERAGLSQVAVNAHHHGVQIADYVLSRRPAGEVWVNHEPELLGTAGAVHAVSARVSWPLLTWNADLWTEPPLPALLSEQPVFACLLVAPAQGPGSVGLAVDGSVVRLRGERFGHEVAQAEFLGLAIWGRAAAKSMPERGCLIGDVCLPWLRAGGSIQTRVCGEPWFDVGSLSGLAAANGHWLAGRSLDAFVASDAEVAEGVRVAHSLVGARCHVSGVGEVRRCILLPGCHATAPLVDRLVLPSGRAVQLDGSSHALAVAPNPSP